MSAPPGKRFPLTLSDLAKDPGLRSGSGVGRPGSTSGSARGGVPTPRGKSTPGTLGARIVPPMINSPVAAAVGSTTPAPFASPAVSVPGRHLAAKNKPVQATTPLSHLSLTSDRVRERMVERIRASGVSNPDVLAAMRDIPRHLFVDLALAPQAYEEAALPIGHRQTISKPAVVARMIEIALNGRPGLDKVLEVGTGCGYQAAVLARLAREVFSIERIKPLHERAKRNLRPLRAPNIRLHYGDGRIGMPASAPFDAIVVAAAGLDIPPALVEQLAIGGRLIAPVGSDSQVLTLVERLSAKQWRETVLDRVFFVPLKSGVI